MAKATLSQPLRHLDIFSGLTPLQITEIARRADRIVYKPGAAIISTASPMDAAVVLVSGNAERLRGPGLDGLPVPVTAGAILSEMSMLIDTPSTSTVVAATEVRALRITRDAMHAHMAEDPAIAEHFVAKIAARLARLGEEMRAIEETLARSGSLSPRPAAAVMPAEQPRKAATSAQALH